jgi:transposase
MVEAAVGATDQAPASGGRRMRRSYSAEEKRRMIAEASQPGASVADIARRHGVNANLLFNWRRLSREAALAEATASASMNHDRRNGMAAAAEPPMFVPIGVSWRAEDEGPALIAPPGSVAGGHVASARTTTSARPTPGERPGMIEIELVDGTRLRVDACVNERSLRRVLTVLKAVS